MVKLWWKGTVAFVFDEWHLVVAAIAAAGFVVAGLFGLAAAGLSEATLGVLAAVTIALAVEREARAKLSTTIGALQASLAETNTAIEALKSPRSYHVQRYEGRWFIDETGSAKSVKRKLLKFEQDNVFAIREWSKTDGREVSRTYTFEGQEISSFASWRQPGSERTYDLVYLGRLPARGDVGEFAVVRDLVDAFVEPDEYVSASIEEPTAIAHLAVRWPTTKAPSTVCYEVWKNNVRQTQVDITVNVQLKNGRPTLEYTIGQPEVDTRLQVTWRW